MQNGNDAEAAQLRSALHGNRLQSTPPTCSFETRSQVVRFAAFDSRSKSLFKPVEPPGNGSHRL
jgi:hypothetical protein